MISPQIYFFDRAKIIGSIKYENPQLLSWGFKEDVLTSDSWNAKAHLIMEYPEGYSITNSWNEKKAVEKFLLLLEDFDSKKEAVEKIMTKIKEIISDDIKEIKEIKVTKETDDEVIIEAEVTARFIDEKATERRIQELKKQGYNFILSEAETSNSIYRLYKETKEKSISKEDFIAENKKFFSECEKNKKQETNNKILIGSIRTDWDYREIYLVKQGNTGIIEILKDFAGIVIGKKGSNLNKLKEKTGLKFIKVIPKTTLGMKDEKYSNFYWSFKL